MTMLICSALYNIFAKDEKRGLLRKLDHAAIFLMIAGTYTPLAAIIIGGWTGGILLAIVWTGALAGVFLKLFRMNSIDRITVPLCLALGWVVVFAFKPLLDNASAFAFWMIILGGLLYTIGTAFYAWKRLPFQNAIWHVFVLAAAICHFSAVMSGRCPGTDIGGLSRQCVFFRTGSVLPKPATALISEMTVSAGDGRHGVVELKYASFVQRAS